MCPHAVYWRLYRGYRPWIGVIIPVCTQSHAHVQTDDVNCAYAQVHELDLLIAPNKCEARYLIGDTAKSWIAYDHCSRGAAKRFETRSNRWRIGTRTLSLIHGKS
jgi:hypothetical protein